MIKTPLSTVIGGVGMYTKNSLIIGGKTEPPFDPASLFKNGEQGFWLDPNDLSTMFQDVGCTVPITVGQTVGYIYDKAKPIVKRRNMLADSSLSLGISSITTRGGELTIIDDKYIKLDTVNKTVDSYAYMRPVLPIGTRVTFSVSLKREDGQPINPTESSGSDCRIIADGYALTGSALSAVDIGGGGVRVSASYEITKSSSSCGIVKYKFSSDAPVIAWDYQIDVGDVATAYQDTYGALDWEGKFGAYQVDTAKQPILRFNEVTNKYYLEFDGIDDFLIIAYRVFQTNQKCTVLTHVKTINTDTKTLISSGSAGYLRTTATIFSQYDTANPPNIRQANQDILEAYFDNSIGTRLKTSIAELQSDLKITPFNEASVFIATFSDTHTTLRAKIHLYSLIMRSDILDSEIVDKVKKVM